MCCAMPGWVRSGLLLLLAGAGGVVQGQSSLRILPAIQTLGADGGAAFQAELLDQATGLAVPCLQALEWRFEGRDGRGYASAKGILPLVEGGADAAPAWSPGEVIRVCARIPGSDLWSEARLLVPGPSVRGTPPPVRPKRLRFPEALEPQPALGDGAPAAAAGSSPLKRLREARELAGRPLPDLEGTAPPATGPLPGGGGAPPSTPNASSSPTRSRSSAGPDAGFSTPPSGRRAILLADLVPRQPTPGAARRFPHRSGEDGPRSQARFPVFHDAEILWEHLPERPARAVFQQQSLQSCGPAVLAMRLEDLGLATRFEWLEQLGRSALTNAGNLVELLGASRLKAATKVVLLPPAGEGASLEGRKAEVFEILSGMLRDHGPIITSITDPHIRGHWIIVDRLVGGPGLEEKLPGAPHAWIRDPYHGWAIPVTLEALLGRMVDENDPQSLLAIHAADGGLTEG